MSMSMSMSNYQLSRVVRKPDFSIFENKAADQLCVNHTADQRLCFHYIYIFSHLSFLSKFKISSLCPASMTVDCTAWFVSDLQGQLLEGVECHIYLYCFTFDDINLNRVLSLLSYFQKNIAIRKCVQIK